MSEAKVISVETISAAIESAAKEYGAALKTWYPQHGDNAPAERNLTLHLAFALRTTMPGMRFYAEPNLGETSRKRVDVVAYEPIAKSLVVVEAKRILDREPKGLDGDIDRVNAFHPKNDNHNTLEVTKKFGVLLTQTISDANAEWWTERQGKTGVAWVKLAVRLAELEGRGGKCASFAAHEWRDSSERERWRHVLWCVWPCPLT